MREGGISEEGKTDKELSGYAQTPSPKVLASRNDGNALDL